PLGRLLRPDDARRRDRERRLTRLDDLDVADREPVEHPRQGGEDVRPALQPDAVARLRAVVQPELMILRDRLLGHRLGRRGGRRSALRPTWVTTLSTQELERHDDLPGTCYLRRRNRSSGSESADEV